MVFCSMKTGTYWTDSISYSNCFQNSNSHQTLGICGILWIWWLQQRKKKYAVARDQFIYDKTIQNASRTFTFASFKLQGLPLIIQLIENRSTNFIKYKCHILHAINIVHCSIHTRIAQLAHFVSRPVFDSWLDKHEKTYLHPPLRRLWAHGEIIFYSKRKINMK